MKKSLNILFLLFLCVHQISLANPFDTAYEYCKIAATKDRIIKGLIFHSAAHLIYKARGIRTDEKGNWRINGEVLTPEERYNRIFKSPLFSKAFITGLPSYVFDITFGTESEFKDKEMHTLEPVNEDTKTQTTIVSVKKICTATGSGAYCWYADNFLRHISDVAKTGFGILPVIITIKELADKAQK
jgi:hypothetical protein